MGNLFDGPGAALVGRIMAKANAEAEAEAVAMLDPAPGSSVLVIGFGPGVGVSALAERGAHVLGVDPSAAMLKQATRRNRRWIAEGRVTLERATADCTPADAAAFDGVIAVNTLQLCEPIAATATELARVLKPGARLVSLTHDWAAAKHAGSVEAWTCAVLAALANAGFIEGRAAAGKAEKGRAIALTARRI